MKKRLYVLLACFILVFLTTGLYVANADGLPKIGLFSREEAGNPDSHDTISGIDTKEPGSGNSGLNVPGPNAPGSGGTDVTTVAADNKLPSDSNQEESFLIITTEDGYGETSEKNTVSESAGYIAAPGEVITIGGLSDLEITIEDVGETYVTFTTGSSVFLSDFTDKPTDYFMAVKGFPLHIWNSQMTDASSDYYIDIADVVVRKVDDPGFFYWDMDLDGSEEEAFLSFTDRGSNVLSFSYLQVSDPAVDKICELYMDGVHDISQVRKVIGANDTFLVIDALYDDYETQDAPVSLVVLYEAGELILAQ